MATLLVAEVPCLLRHFPLANTLHIVPYNEYIAASTAKGFITWYPSVAVSCGFDIWFAVRLVMDYSEIDHIYHSIEAQCVSHHLPPVDCHTLQLLKSFLNPFAVSARFSINPLAVEATIY